MTRRRNDGEDNPARTRYTRQRLQRLVRGGAGELYDAALAATLSVSRGERIRSTGHGTFDIVMPDPSGELVEKLDVERAIASLRLTEQQRAMGALLSMGWSYQSISRVLHTNVMAVKRLVDGTDTQPGLASRLEGFLNGTEEVP